MANKENKIRDAILDALNALPFCMSWPVYSGGRYLANIKRMVPMKHRWHRPGVPDILGVYCGVAIAFEVKTAKGRVAEHQKKWAVEFTSCGGAHAVVRNVSDALAALGYIDAEKLLTPTRRN